MNVTDIADETYRELGNPSGSSIPKIVFWFTSNIGQLNVLIGSCYTAELEIISPDLSDIDKVIFKLLYTIYYYDRLIACNLGASAFDWSEVIEGDTSLRRVSKNEISKTYLQLKKALEDRLNRLIMLKRQGEVLPVSLSSIHHLLRYNRVLD